jgi:hypothetical protein
MVEFEVDFIVVINVMIMIIQTDKQTYNKSNNH